jgi:hypothetical protein
MRLGKKLFAAIIFTLVLLAFNGVALAQSVDVTINGVRVNFADQGPIIEQGRTLVPVGGVFDALGFEVEWNEQAQVATLSRADYIVLITIGSDVFTVNGASHTLEVPARIIGGRTMLPIRAVLESVGYVVGWDGASRTVLVGYGAGARVSTLAGTGSHGYRDGAMAQFNLPANIFGGADGAIYVIDTYNNLVRVIGSGGNVGRFAGSIQELDDFGFPSGRYRDGAALTAALFNRPSGGAVNSEGEIFIADGENHAIRIITNGDVFTFAGGEASGHTDGSVENARFYNPSAIAIGHDGSIYVADTFNHVIRRIDPNGYVTTVAGVPEAYGFRDGASGTALFNAPMGIAVNENGVIFVADTGNHLIRVIEDGNVRTLAGTLVFPADIAWEEPSDFDNQPMGGFANGFNAMFNQPTGLTLWGDALIIADTANNLIRIILPSGEARTLAGTGYPGHSDSLPFSSEFHLPRGVFVRGDMLYIADTGNNMVRVLSLANN